jgi:RHS repeat-associated protein
VGQPQTTWDDKFRVRLPHPGDGQAMRNYTEAYEYDAVGNFEKLIHQATNGSWTRTYAYDEDSLTEPATLTQSAKKSNRLSRTTIGDGVPEPYTYDAHGNMTRMDHLPLMQWDYRDQLQATAQQIINNGVPETTWYVYDASGQRVRKVTESAVTAQDTANGKKPKRIKERIYLGGFEIYRDYENDGVTKKLACETLHIMDDKQRIALVETRTQGNEPGVPARLMRYQFGNHLGSACLELDDQAQIISREEYTPYGSTAFQAGRSAAEVSLKRYRYTGKEQDGESGLYYHGARYYMPWLARWLSSDPAGLTHGVDLYSYVGNNPCTFRDPTGHAREPGHFNLVWFLGLAAGYRPKAAYLNAFYSMMPDEVKELDAIGVKTEELLQQEILSIGFMDIDSPFVQRPLVPYGSSEYTNLIQTRVHALTGGPSDVVRENTTDALLKTDPANHLRLGLLSHRYFDLMHSRIGDEKNMYPVSPVLKGWGHATALTQPDDLHRRPQLVRDVAVGYFRILKEIGESQGISPVLTEEQVSQAVDEITSLQNPSDERQIDKLREFTISLITSGSRSSSSEELRELNYMLSYRPEKEAATRWKDFMFKHYPETLGRDLSLYKVYREIQKLPSGEEKEQAQTRQR